MLMVGRSLQEAIAVAKVHGVEESIEQCFRLKQEVCFVVTVTTALFFVFNHARPSPSAIYFTVVVPELTRPGPHKRCVW